MQSRRKKNPLKRKKHRRQGGVAASSGEKPYKRERFHIDRYCGPGTKYNGTAYTELEGECKEHDQAYSQYSPENNPLFYYNNADEQFLEGTKDISGVKAKVARSYFRAKKFIAPRMPASKEIQFSPSEPSALPSNVMLTRKVTTKGHKSRVQMLRGPVRRYKKGNIRSRSAYGRKTTMSQRKRSKSSSAMARCMSIAKKNAPVIRHVVRAANAVSCVSGASACSSGINLLKTDKFTDLAGTYTFARAATTGLPTAMDLSSAADNFKMCVVKAKVDVELRNASNQESTVEWYVLRPKVRISKTPSQILDEEYADVYSPVGSYTGTTDPTFSVEDSEWMKKWYKVERSGTLRLAPTGRAILNHTWYPGKWISHDEISTMTGTYTEHGSCFVFLKVCGGLVHDSTTTTLVNTGIAKVDYLYTLEIDYVTSNEFIVPKRTADFSGLGTITVGVQDNMDVEAGANDGDILV